MADEWVQSGKLTADVSVYQKPLELLKEGC